MKWTTEQIVKWTKGRIVSTQAAPSGFNHFATDTRKDCHDKIFIALKGDAYDAHDYLDKAVQSGATGLMVHRLDTKFEHLKTQVLIIEVADTLAALQSWAHEYRKTLSAKIFGITGSNGKTTTKEFLASILSLDFKTYFTEGSFNNHWGLPFSLLNVEKEHQCVVLEMGMNHAGEITRLVEIADPDFVVCTMVGTAHIEHFGSIKGIAKAKEEIYQASRETTVRVFNQDQELTFDMMYPVAKRFPASRMLSFSGKNDQADVYFHIDTSRSSTDSNFGLYVKGVVGGVHGEAHVPIFGEHNLTNLMAAATMALSYGMKPEHIWKALARCGSAWGRNEMIATQEGVHILFDGYNANPDSMKALFKNVRSLSTSGRKFAALGQMKELGEFAKTFHEEVAQAAAQAGFEAIFFYGENFKDFAHGLEQAKFSKGYCAPEFSQAMGLQLKEQLQPGDLLVIKGSRGAKTEKYITLFNPVKWKPK